MNILIVGDEQSFRSRVEKTLTTGDFGILMAQNAIEGLKIIAEKKVDLVISDLEMHLMDGFSFCKTARDIPERQDLPFLFVSTYGDEEELATVNTLRNASFLRKGDPLDKLIALIYHLTTPEENGGGFSRSSISTVSQKLDQKKDISKEKPIKETDKFLHARILVVDDDDALRMLLSDMLSREGYIVSTASDGEEAITFLQNDNTDLVLLDIIMPNVSGFGVLKFIKENNVACKVIMLTAYTELRLAVESKTLGADDFIGKPFMRQDLLNTIKRVLNE